MTTGFRFSLGEIGRNFDEWWFSLLGFYTDENEYRLLLVHKNIYDGWHFDVLWLKTLFNYIIDWLVG